VTGDLTGFLAACYFRGIPFIQMPTTLLAQVDASVGGKVGVNLPGAKNSLGFFHQPEAVFTELAFLDTLPRRERAAGFAEMAKIGAILDADFLGDLGRKAQSLLGGVDLEDSIATSCLLKARVIASDEKEAGPRQLLNFGHTLAHAIEGYQPKPDMIHGEAVAVGMCFALALGESIGITAPGLAARMEKLLADVDLPTRVPAGIGADALREVMDNDKKNRGRTPRMVMVKDWGIAEFGVELDEAVLMSALTTFCQPT
jgi:3-dehydroquinate synthase